METRTLFARVKSALSHRYTWLAAHLLVWILLHYVAGHLYVYACTPLTLTGFIMSPFVVDTPHCKGMRWLLTEGASTMHMVWGFIGMCFVEKLVMERI